MAGKRRERPGMILYYHHMKQAVEKLTTQELGELTRALYAYVNGEETELGEKVGIFFGFMTDAIDRDNERYEETCERNRERARRNRHKTRDCAQEPEDGDVCGGAEAARCEGWERLNGVKGEVREVCELHDAAANQTEPNQTEPNQTEPNQTEPNPNKPKQKASRARGAPASAFYGRRGKGGRTATVTGGVCGDPIPWA